MCHKAFRFRGEPHSRGSKRRTLMPLSARHHADGRMSVLELTDLGTEAGG